MLEPKVAPEERRKSGHHHHHHEHKHKEKPPKEKREFGAKFHVEKKHEHKHHRHHHRDKRKSKERLEATDQHGHERLSSHAHVKKLPYEIEREERDRALREQRRQSALARANMAQPVDMEIPPTPKRRPRGKLLASREHHSMGAALHGSRAGVAASRHFDGNSSTRVEEQPVAFPSKIGHDDACSSSAR